MREGKIISSRFWAKTLAVGKETDEIGRQGMKIRLVLLTTALAILATATISSDQKIMSLTADQSSNGKFMTAATVSEPLTTAVNFVANNDSRLIATSSSRKNKPREVSCENPEVTTSKLVPVEERNAFLRETTAKIPADSTPKEKAAFIEDIKAAAPAQEFTTTVYVDDSEAVGDPPDPNQDQDGKKFDTWVQKVKKAGCNTQSVPSTGGRLASPAAQYFTAGWKSCTNSTWTTNNWGATLVKLTQTSRWYVDSRGLPNYPSRSFYSSAGWGWDEKGNPQGQTGMVTIRYGVPLQFWNWTGQNFNFKHFGIELFTKYLDVDHYFGYQGRCGILPWWP